MIIRMKNNTQPTQAQLHITQAHDLVIGLINQYFEHNTFTAQEYVDAIAQEENEYNKLMNAKRVYVAKDLITQSYIIKGDILSHPELTTHEKYASVFTSKSSAYKYAWQVFKIHKNDLVLIEL